MRKFLATYTIFVLLLSMSLATAVQPIIKDARLIEPDGSFSGYIGIPKQDPVIMGNISGVYKLLNRGGGFNASWDIDYKNFSGSGTVRGIFGKNILLGKLSAEGYNKTMPIIGFIKFDVNNQTFIGRAMSYVGPALYFWGTYQPN